jgi:predicted nuclease of restriction endonuclease-like (RecB) superfamily
MNNAPIHTALLQSIRELIQQGRQQIHRSVNSAMVQTYWHIGRLIVEDEQKGEHRAEYGKQQLQQLSARLTDEFGKGFDVTNLRNMRRFYQVFVNRETVSPELSWSHYNALSRIENPSAREWYAQEAITHAWSVRALERQIGVLYYERLLASKDRSPVEAEAKSHTDALLMNPKHYLRDPYILDFLNLESGSYQEASLKKAKPCQTKPPNVYFKMTLFSKCWPMAGSWACLKIQS